MNVAQIHYDHLTEVSAAKQLLLVDMDRDLVSQHLSKNPHKFLILYVAVFHQTQKQFLTKLFRK